MSARIANPFFLSLCAALMMLPSLSFAQFGGGNNGGGFNNGGFNNNQVGGVKIDVDGVLSSATSLIKPETLEAMQNALRQSTSKLDETTKLRMISLKSLEKLIADAKAANKPLPLEVRFMAGLQRIEFVVASPDNDDILIGGPAEGLKVNDQGDVVGAASGRPAIRLEDFIVAMRSVDNARQGDGVSVSINPTPEGIKNLKKAFRQIQKFHPSMQTALEQAMGPQQITLTGVPKDSRFSQVLVAADYKMKRFSMGLEAAPISNFPSLMEMAQRKGVQRMAASPRFWMECSYQPLATSKDNNVWQIPQSGVKTLTENDKYNADGTAKGTGKQDKLAKKWAEMMTDRYDELAQAEPVFRELQNLMDLSVVAAIIRKYDMKAQVGLKMPLLTGETESVSLVAGPAPKTVPTQCSFVKVSNTWLISTSGGVMLDSWGVIEKPEVKNELAQMATTDLPANRWWWNAN